MTNFRMLFILFFIQSFFILLIYERLIYNSSNQLKMSSYPISGCGLPSKPRAAQPSMFQILSWAGEHQLALSRFQQKQQKQVLHHNILIQPNQTLQTQPIRVAEQVYKEHRSPQKLDRQEMNTENPSANTRDQNISRNFKKSRLQPKQVKHQLYSYEPVNLKANRSKSARTIQKSEIKQVKQTKKQVKQTKNILIKEPELDQKTIQERKQKLKEFEVFTRALPNSAFTTYYGKPAFEAYGRGTSFHNLKSFNVMPHKGDNHPKNLQSHYTALIKARNVQSKSNLPRKPLQQNLPSNIQQENQQVEQFKLPLEKPDLIKSNIFATLKPQTRKKAGPPQVSKKASQKGRRSHTSNQVQRERRPKTAIKPSNDGLKYINKRQNLIDILQQKKLRASQLAYKVTQCYPLQLDPQQLQNSVLSKQNWSQSKPAGKKTQKGDAVSDLLHSKLVLQETNIQPK